MRRDIRYSWGRRPFARLLAIAVLLASSLSVLVPSVSAASYTFTQNSDITINDNANASPYPSFLYVENANGPITDINLQLTITHGYPNDVDILLVSPQGTAVIVMSDVCGTSGTPLSNKSFEINDEGSVPFTSGPCNSFFYEPTNNGTGDGFPAPAPAEPFATTMAAFDGQNPNGNWLLYVRDDFGGQTGLISTWSIVFTTNDATINIRDATTAAPYPSPRNVAGLSGVITDVNVVMTDINHRFPDDINILLVGPTGLSVVLMGDACGSDDFNNKDITFDDEAFDQLSDADNSGCFDITQRPSNYSANNTFDAPAPAQPYFDRLGVYDGTNPNGTWSLYVEDDAGGDSGYIVDWQLVITTATQTDLISNGSFSSAINTASATSWKTFAVNDANITCNPNCGPNVFPASGIMQWTMNNVATTSSQAVVFQNTGVGIAAERGLDIGFDLGNSSGTRRRVQVLIHDGDFQDSTICIFWLAGAQPLRRYRILTHTNKNWTNASLSFYSATSSPQNFSPYIQLDNVTMRQRPDITVNETLCLDQVNPFMNGVADGPNIITNGTFTSGLASWSPVFAINAAVVAGRVEMYDVPPAVPQGVLLQNTGNTSIGANTTVEASFQLGTTYNGGGAGFPARTRVRVLLHEANFSDYQSCNFWLDNNAPLQTYVVRFNTTTAWDTGASISFYPGVFPSAPVGRILLDNVTMQTRPAQKLGGTYCYEPGTAFPSSVEDIENGVMGFAPNLFNTETGELLDLLPTLIPTGIPDGVPTLEAPLEPVEPEVILPTTAPVEILPPEGEGLPFVPAIPAEGK